MREGKVTTSWTTWEWRRGKVEKRVGSGENRKMTFKFNKMFEDLISRWRRRSWWIWCRPLHTCRSEEGWEKERRRRGRRGWNRRREKYIIDYPSYLQLSHFEDGMEVKNITQWPSIHVFHDDLREVRWEGRGRERSEGKRMVRKMEARRRKYKEVKKMKKGKERRKLKKKKKTQIRVAWKYALWNVTILGWGQLCIMWISVASAEVFDSVTTT